MLSAAVAALACLCLARASPAEPHGLRAHAQNTYNIKDLTSILASIDERLRVLETISEVQVKQARRLDVIEDKLDRVETTLTIRLERAQLAAEKLEHRLHMLQTNVQTSIKASSEKLEKSQTKIVEIAQNLTNEINIHTHLLEKVNGAYADTWRRGLLLESLVRDGMSLVNATRRELADGLRSLARRQRDARMSSVGLENAFSRSIDLKMQEVLETQKRFVDSCQRVQRDDPTHVADVLEKLIDSLINKTAATFDELQNIQLAMRKHDNKVIKLLSTKPVQTDISCRKLETMFRNASKTTFNEKELQSLTEKFIDLTNRADASLQKLEARLNDEIEDIGPPSEVTVAANLLLQKLDGIKNEKGSHEDSDWEEDEQDIGYFDDNSSMDDFIEEDEEASKYDNSKQTATESPFTRPTHRRHLHKHPYDRGPSWKINKT